MARPTIIDVARAAGVSKATVSLVLNSSPVITARTRDAVLRAMADLGYVYNRAAANLRSAQVGLVGLVINDLRNPFFTEFATAVQMALSAAGYATVLANTDEDPALQARTITAMIEHGVSGFIISPAYGDEAGTFGPLERAGIPALQVLRKVSPRTDLFPFAAPDYAEGGRLATGHLLACGARRVAFIGGVDGRAVTAERLSGYLEAIAAAGLAPTVIPGRPTRAFGRECARLFHPDATSGAAASPDAPPDAALCFNDLVALGLVSGLAGLGVAVGRDVRVVGFDDIEDCADSHPPLSSVHCGIDAFGRQMAATLTAWLNHGQRPPPETRTPVTLSLRASSATA